MVDPKTPAVVAPVVAPTVDPTTPAPGAPVANLEAGAQPNPGEPGEKMVPLSALHESRNSIKEMKAEMDNMRVALAAGSMYPPQQPSPQYPGPSQQYVQPQPGQGQSPQPSQLDAMYQDPSQLRGAVQREMMQALSWYDRTNSAVDAQIDNLEKSKPDANKYRTDINRYLRTLPPEQRGKQGVAELAYYVVKGQKVDDLIDMSKEQLINRIKAGEQVQGLGAVSSPAAPAPSDAQPTAAEADIASKMGMTTEEYMKGKV